MKNKAGSVENKMLMIVAIVMCIGIIVLSAYMLFFKTKIVAGFNVKDSDVENEFFIKDLLVQKIDLYDIDFDHAYSLSRTNSAARINGVYVTQASVDELRDYYMQSLDDSQLIGDNTAVSMNVAGKIDDMDVEVRNYFSEVTNVVEITIDVDVVLADYFEEDIEKLYPMDSLLSIEGVDDILKGDRYGGFIMYTFDVYDQFAYVGVPKISRAFKNEDAFAEFEKIKEVIEQRADETIVSDDAAKIYAKKDGYLYMFTASRNKDDDGLIIVNAQKISK